MTREERILNHESTDLDLYMINTAWDIVRAFNSSYNPYLISPNVINKHFVKYVEDIGFALCEKNGEEISVVFIKIHLDTFVESVLFYLAHCDVTWQQIKENSAVKNIYP